MFAYGRYMTNLLQSYYIKKLIINLDCVYFFLLFFTCYTLFFYVFQRSHNKTECQFIFVGIFQEYFSCKFFFLLLCCCFIYLIAAIFLYFFIMTLHYNLHYYILQHSLYLYVIHMFGFTRTLLYC